MGTTTTTFPNTLTNGQVADADEVMANFNALKTTLETTGLQIGNLQEPYNIQALHIDFGSITSGNSDKRRFKLPASIGATFVEAQLSYEADDASTPTVSVQATVGGSNLLASTLTNSTPASTTTSSSFSTTGGSGGDAIVVTVSVAGGDAGEIQFTLWSKMEHQS